MHHIGGRLKTQQPAVDDHGRRDHSVASLTLCAQCQLTAASALHAQAAVGGRQHPQVATGGADQNRTGAHLRDLFHIQLATHGQLGQGDRAAVRVAGLHLHHVQVAQVDAAGRAHRQLIGHQGLARHAVTQTGHRVGLQHQAMGRVQRDVVAAVHTGFDAVLQGDVVDRVQRDRTVHPQEEVAARRHVGHLDAAAVHRQVVPEQRHAGAVVRANANLTRSAHRVTIDFVANHDPVEPVDQRHHVLRRQVQAQCVGIRRIAHFVTHTQRGRAQGQLTTGRRNGIGTAQEVDFIGLDQDVATHRPIGLHGKPAVKNHPLGTQNGQVAAQDADAVRKTDRAAGMDGQVTVQQHLAFEGHVVRQVEHARADLDTQHAQAFKRVLRVFGLGRLGKADATGEGHVTGGIDLQAVGAVLTVAVDDVPGLPAQHHVARAVRTGHRLDMAGQDDRVVQEDGIGSRHHRVLVPVCGET